MPDVDGFDDLIKKLTTAKDLSEKIESAWKNISGYASEAGVGTGGGGGGGGQMGVGKGKNRTGKAMGSGGGKAGGGRMPSQGDMNTGGAKAAEASQDNLTMKRTVAEAMGKPIVTNTARAMGMGKIITSPQNAAELEHNKKLIGDARQSATTGLLGGYVGVNAARFNALPSAAQDRIQSSFYGISDSLSLMKGLSSSLNSFMPEVAGTMNRAAGYYNAGVYGGNTMARGKLEDITFGTMSRLSGLTSAGSDARVAQFLGARGMTASGASGSTYQETLRTVSNAARYMNISNEEAAASIEGMTSAKGSAEALRNFGIYTSYLDTGKEKTQGQIFEELAQRLTAGRGKASVEQTQASIRRGALGVTIDSFFQGDQQGGQMFKQYMIERAKGNKMDLSQDKDMATALGNPGNINPLNSQMAMATSDTAAMGKAEDQYVKGIGRATLALQALNAAAGALSTALGGGAAMIQTLFGHRTVSGLASGLETTVDFASKGIAGIGQALMGMDALNPVPALAEAGIIGGSMAASLGVAAASTAGAAILGGFGGPGPTLGMSSTGTGGDNFGNVKGGIGGPDASLGGAQGTGSNYLFDLSLLKKFGINRGESSGHHGVDYGHRTGDPVYAVADGTVTRTRSTYNKNDKEGNSIGNFVTILHTAANGDKYTSVYGHLSKVMVSEGDKVSRGQKIGEAGNTGHSTGPHVHFEIRKGRVVMAGTGTQVLTADAAKVLGSGATVGAGDEGTSDGSGSMSGTSGEATNAATQALGMSTPAAAALAAGKDLTATPSQATASMKLLSGLYSGDTSKILASVGAMATNLGAGQAFNDSMSGDYNKYQDLVIPDGAIKNPLDNKKGNNVNNNVSIVVQVPDVTSADAVKFANLVKKYLDEDSLLSNTGSY